MELDRQNIERKDFSAVRRGYDPDEVDGHLREIADSVNALRRTQRPAPASLATQAADQVRTIVEAAERSATEIQLRYTEAHGITPESIVKGVSDIAEFLTLEAPTVPGKRRRGRQVEGMGPEEIEKLVATLEEEMRAAAEELRFEYAAKLRDEIKELRRELQAAAEAAA